MRETAKTIMKQIVYALDIVGFDVRKFLALKNYLKFQKDKLKWIRQGGKVHKNFMILTDYSSSAGVADGHYFHQDLLVARMIMEKNPIRHVDVGSRIDGFVAHVASFRQIEVIDVRSLEPSLHSNIIFRQADLMKPQSLGFTDSLSCLHAIEHFGLGRYTDPIDIDGHNKGIANLVSMISPMGRLYISFPIGEKDQVYFNAHRIFHPLTILAHPSIASEMTLKRFDYVDDAGILHLDQDVNSISENIKFGCGIYTFERKGPNLENAT